MIRSATASLKRVARKGFESSSVAAAARRIAAGRGHSLVLLYHRVLPAAARTGGVVPTVTPERFDRQIQTLGEMGRIVPLAELLQEDPGRTPRFALTFDDDYVTHVEWVLPALRRWGIAGAFFLSGRSLHGVGGYWFEALEQLIVDRGLRRVGVLLGMAEANAATLALACEKDPHLQRIVARECEDSGAPILLSRDIQALAHAGMTIGFHTLEHRALTELADAELEDAVVRGRDELAAVAGSSLVLFAYPHGRGDGRSAVKVRKAGYVGAWTGRARPMRPGDNPYLLGRWEPGGLAVDDFVTSVSIRLIREARTL